MSHSKIILKPIVTEKVTGQTEKSKTYSFAVAKHANKLDIAKAITEYYNVTVASVNTCVVPAKNKVRYTTRGVLKGRKPGYKKAIVTLSSGEIDLYIN